MKIVRDIHKAVADKDSVILHGSACHEALSLYTGSRPMGASAVSSIYKSMAYCMRGHDNSMLRHYQSGNNLDSTTSNRSDLHHRAMSWLTHHDRLS